VESENQIVFRLNMKNKRTKVITIQTWRKTIIRREPAAIFIYCERCGGEKQMFSPDEFARLQGTTARVVYRQIESGECHFIETADGALLVCGAGIQNNLTGAGGKI
jgi:hypothetical protein